MMNKNKNKKKLAAAFLAGVMAVGAAFVPAADTWASSDAEYSKNENVYVRLDTDGDVEGTYVVNTFTITEAGEITDYGDYASVMNLTNLDGIVQDGDEYSFYAEKGKFYYQGNLDHAQLPWKFEITYLLDGKKLKEEEIAGAQGDLEIHMEIKKNPAVSNSAFYDAYLLQVSFTLDNDLCRDIEAKGASITDAGAKEQITFTVLPDAAQAMQEETSDEEDTQEEASEDEEAQDEESSGIELVVKAEVEDFEMDDISIAGAPMAVFPVSFVSEENTEMGQTVFIMSAQGISIPEEEVVVEETVDDRNFFEKLIDKIKNHAEE